MNASAVRDFFLGAIPAEALLADLRDAWRWRSSDVRELQMQDISEDFTVEPSHLVRLCDAVVAGQLPPEVLEPIGFGLIASDHFVWDGDTPEGSRVAEALYDWSSPEINFALTVETARKFRSRLLSGEDQFTRDDHYREPKPVPASSWNNRSPTPRPGAS